MLSDEAVRFRRALIDALWSERQWGYVTEDVFIGECPVCGGPVGVHFAGYAPRATLRCHLGCTEQEIAEQLNLPNVEAVP
jgi:hypothetical protein